MSKNGEMRKLTLKQKIVSPELQDLFLNMHQINKFQKGTQVDYFNDTYNFGVICVIKPMKQF